MAYTVEKLGNEPIILVTLIGEVNQSDGQQAFVEIAETIQSIDGHAYVIHDFRRYEVDFATIVRGLAMQTKGTPGSASDPHASTIIVGTSEMAKLVSEALKQEQYGSLKVPAFDSMDDALSYIRQQIS